jgi:putative membrane protein (TIGR04086 family)
MNVRWMAVLTGFIVDIVLTSLLYALFYPQTLTTPEALPTNDLVFFGLGVLATGVGGYVAGRMAQAQRELHGLLVGVVGILVLQLQLAVGVGPGLARAQVIALGAGCLVGALGGLLSRLPPLRRPPQ